MVSDEKLLYAGEHLHFLKQQSWEFVRHKKKLHGVVIIAVTDDHKLLLVEQTRPPVGGRTIELPAGSIEDGRENAARNEMHEETCYSFTSFREVVEGCTSPGMTSDINVVCIVGGLQHTERPSKKQEGDLGSEWYMVNGRGDEDIKVWEVPLDRIVDWLRAEDRKAIIDLRVYAGLFLITSELRLAVKPSYQRPDAM